MCSSNWVRLNCTYCSTLKWINSAQWFFDFITCLRRSQSCIALEPYREAAWMQEKGESYYIREHNNVENIWLAYVENSFLWPEENGMNSVLEENISTVSNEILERVKVLTAIGSLYVAVASPEFLGLSKWCTRATIDHKHFVTHSSRCGVYWADFVEILDMEASQEILEAPFPMNTFLSVVGYFAPSFQSEQTFLVLTIV